ncbi:hypothetical protein PIROE2DRAFT_13916 [Piromyces sp. E2]|nr:hypothetical protein PIROE2DRAFT_13916 [Piromyces sp. E2]|eukprot:OUM60333.1 hypothetical protein PIROE2DRAFT_13916 [Piromyces sp. E2]
MYKDNSKVILTYFNFRGRGECIRLLLEDAGIEYEYEGIPSLDYWVKNEKPNRDKYPFCQLPVVSIDGKILAQQDAILRTFARAKGYYGENDEEKSKIDMMAGGIEDLRIQYSNLIYSPEFEAKKDKFMAKWVDRWLFCVNKLLSENNVGQYYLVGKKISFVDFTMFEMLNLLTYLKDSCLEKYPLLQAYMKRIYERPNIKKYLESDRRFKKVNANDNGADPN